MAEYSRRRIHRRTETGETHVETERLPPDPPVTVSVRGRLLVAVAGLEFAEPWDVVAD